MTIEFNAFYEDPKRHVKLTAESFEELAGLYVALLAWNHETFERIDIEDVPFETRSDADEAAMWAEEPAPQPVRAVSAPSQAATQASRKQAAVTAPTCPYCNGETWDNRQKKASGQFSAKSPDFSCKDKECKADGEHVTAGWIGKDGGIKWNTGI